MSNLFAILLMKMMMMTNYGDNQDVAIERSLYIIWWKRTPIYHKWRDLFETGLNYICSLNEYKFQFHHFWSPLNTFPTCWQRNPRGRSAWSGVYSILYVVKLTMSTLYVDKDRGVPGDGQHYMLSTLYVERRVPGDGQRDYMLTLYSQHYMLTLFLQKIARHYMLII